MNLTLSLKHALAAFPEREAIVDGEFRATYADVGRRVSALCHAFLSMQVVKGQVIGIIGPNSHEYMEVYYAAGVLGLVLNPINFRLAAREIATIFDDSDVSIVVAHTDFADELKEALEWMEKDERSLIKTVIWFGKGERPLLRSAAEARQSPAGQNGKSSLNGRSSFDESFQSPVVRDFDSLIEMNYGKELPECDVKGDELAHLYYTSGTTGRSKGVMLSQSNVTFHALAAAYELGLSDRDTWAHFGPMFHLLDAWSVFSATWAGAKHVFFPYFSAPDVLSIIEQEKVTITALVPTMLNAMLNEPTVEKRDYKSLRLLLTAGSPIAPELVKRAMSTFGCHYWQFYGMTETCPFLTISKPKAEHEGLDEEKTAALVSRTGRPFKGVELRVVRPDGSEVERNDREVGEIVVRGPSVTNGYWRQPDATAQAIKDGWLHTGDLAVVDGENYVNIVDRKKDMIITGGENVYSTEVEYVLYEHPSIRECAVFGIPDNKWGEQVKAVVVLVPGASLKEDEVICFVKERLASYKAPRSVEFMDELPKTGSGKIYKKGLRDKYWQMLEKQVN